MKLNFRKNKQHSKLPAAKSLPKLPLIIIALLSGFVGAYVLIHSFAANDPDLLFNGNFNAPNSQALLDQNNAGQFSPAGTQTYNIGSAKQYVPGHVTVVSDPLNPSSYEKVVKMTVNNTDVAPLTPTENPRAQLIGPDNIKSGDDVWIKTKFLLPDDFPSTVSGWVALFATYGPPYSGSGPWGLELSGNQLHWQRNDTYSYDMPWSTPIIKNQWINILVHQKFDANGFIEMWVNGQPVTFFSKSMPNYYNPNNVAPTTRLNMQTADHTNNGGPNSVRISQYRQKNILDTATIYFGPVIMGKTRAAIDAADVANSGTTPSPSPSDTTSPTVSLTSPASSATVSGSSVAVSATASDNTGVVGVQFKLDSNNLGNEDTSSPYSTTWNTTGASNGTHTLTAIARDAAGNTKTSSAVTVTVSNGSGGTGAVISTSSTPPLKTYDCVAGATNATTAAQIRSAVQSNQNVCVTAAVGNVDLSELGIRKVTITTKGSGSIGNVLIKDTTDLTLRSVRMRSAELRFADRTVIEDSVLGGTQSSRVDDQIVFMPEESDDVTIQDNDIGWTIADNSGNTGYGCRCYGAVNNLHFVGNKVHDIAADGFQGTNGTNVLIDRNEIGPVGANPSSNEHSDNIQVVYNEANMKITNNWIHHQGFYNGNVTGNSGSTYIHGGTTNSLLYENNLVQTNQGRTEVCGLGTGGTSRSNIILRNNTWVDGGLTFDNFPGFEWDCDSGSGNTVANNIAVDPDGGFAQDGSSAAATFSNNLWGQPSLVALNAQGECTSANCNPSGQTAVGYRCPTDVWWCTPGSTQPPADTTNPTVSFSSPANNATVSSVVTAAVNAADNVGVSKVEISLDGSLKITDTQSPYNYSFDSKTTSNGSHTLSAKAYDAAGNTKTSTITINVANIDTTAPNAPTSLTASAANSTTVNLSWTASADKGDNQTGVVKYNVLRGGVVIAQPTTTSYSDATAVANTNYSYTVQAVDGAGNASANSNTVTVKTPVAADTTAPTLPTGVKASAVSTSQINLSWTASTDKGGSGLAGYNIYRDGQKLNSTLLSVTSYGDTTVVAGKTYSYKVQAVDGSGNKSAQTAAVSATTPTAIRGDITGPSGAPNGKIDLSDVSYVIRNYNTSDSRADISGPNGQPDGKVDIYDLSYIIRNYGK